MFILQKTQKRAYLITQLTFSQQLYLAHFFMNFFKYIHKLGYPVQPKIEPGW